MGNMSWTVSWTVQMGLHRHGHWLCTGLAHPGMDTHAHGVIKKQNKTKQWKGAGLGRVAREMSQ